MYRAYYRLKDKPFQLNLDPKFFWKDHSRKSILEYLQYGVESGKGLLLLTGDVGTGKSTLINAFQKALPPDVRMAKIGDPMIDATEFFTGIANAFKIPVAGDANADFLWHLEEFLVSANLRKQKHLLIIDEVQRINPELLETIRHLTNIENTTGKLLNILLVGQDEFRELLLAPENKLIRERITINAHIRPFSLSDTKNYVNHRLIVAGGSGDTFSQDAIEEIYNHSQGYPRLINIICDLALVTGYSDRLQTIERATILECRNKLKIPEKEDSKSPQVPPSTNTTAPSVRGLRPQLVVGLAAAGILVLVCIAYLLVSLSKPTVLTQQNQATPLPRKIATNDDSIQIPQPISASKAPEKKRKDNTLSPTQTKKISPPVPAPRHAKKGNKEQTPSVGKAQIAATIKKIPAPQPQVVRPQKIKSQPLTSKKELRPKAPKPKTLATSPKVVKVKTTPEPRVVSKAKRVVQSQTANAIKPEMSAPVGSPLKAPPKRLPSQPPITQKSGLIRYEALTSPGSTWKLKSKKLDFSATGRRKDIPPKTDSSGSSTQNPPVVPIAPTPKAE